MEKNIGHPTMMKQYQHMGYTVYNEQVEHLRCPFGRAGLELLHERLKFVQDIHKLIHVCLDFMALKGETNFRPESLLGFPIHDLFGPPIPLHAGNIMLIQLAIGNITYLLWGAITQETFFGCKQFSCLNGFFLLLLRWAMMSQSSKVQPVTHEIGLELVRGPLGSGGHLQCLGLTIFQTTLCAHVAPIVDDVVIQLVQPKGTWFQQKNSSTALLIN